MLSRLETEKTVYEISRLTNGNNLKRGKKADQTGQYIVDEHTIKEDATPRS